MPLTPNIEVAQTALVPNIVTVNDTSTGSDGSIASRRIYVQTSDGTYLVPSGTTTQYTVWPYADSSISLDILTQDKAVEITVQWLASNNAVLYDFSDLYCLRQYNKNFFYYLIQQQALTPSILQSSNYIFNMATYWMAIIGANEAVQTGADLSASQNCLDRATNMLNQESIYFK